VIADVEPVVTVGDDAADAAAVTAPNATSTVTSTFSLRLRFITPPQKFACVCIPDAAAKLR
jgi:hypothetical protein